MFGRLALRPRAATTTITIVSTSRHVIARRSSAALVTVIVAAMANANACTGDTTFECSANAQCEGGTCEPLGLCSFPDDGCDSGRRYGELSGTLAGTCVPVDPDTSAVATDVATGGDVTTMTSQTSVTATSTDPTSDPSGSVEATGPATEATSITDSDAESSTDPDTGSSTGDPQPSCIEEAFDDAMIEPELCTFSDKVLTDIDNDQLALSYDLMGWAPGESGSGGVETCGFGDWTGVEVIVALDEAGSAAYTRTFVAIEDDVRGAGVMVRQSMIGFEIGSFLRNGMVTPQFLQSQVYLADLHRFVRLAQLGNGNLAVSISSDGLKWQMVNAFDSQIDFASAQVRIGAGSDDHPLQQDSIRFGSVTVCVP